MKISEKLEKIEAIKRFLLLIIACVETSIWRIFFFQSSGSKTPFFREIVIGNSMNVQT